MKKLTILLTAIAVMLGLSVAIGQTSNRNAVAVLTTTDGGERIGTVEFTPKGEEVVIEVNLMGLEPGSVHGFHIHTFGDMTAVDGTSAGGHFSPDDNPHAAPTTMARHAGDLGNLIVDRHGLVRFKRTVQNITVQPGDKDSIIGRAVVLHAGSDDLTSQPSGDAGPRMAVGVIGYANPEAK